jgi:hypothetical protein
VRRVGNGVQRQAFGHRVFSVERGRLRLAPSNNRLQLTKSAPWQAAKAPPSQLNRVFGGQEDAW